MFISRKRLEYIKEDAKSEGRREVYYEQERSEIWKRINELENRIIDMEHKMNIKISPTVGVPCCDLGNITVEAKI